MQESGMLSSKRYIGVLSQALLFLAPVDMVNNCTEAPTIPAACDFRAVMYESLEHGDHFRTLFAAYRAS
jgi:hypothetical protein